MHRGTRRLLLGGTLGFGAALAAHYILTHDVRSRGRYRPVEDKPGRRVPAGAEVEPEPDPRPRAGH